MAPRSHLQPTRLWQGLQRDEQPQSSHPPSANMPALGRSTLQAAEEHHGAAKNEGMETSCVSGRQPDQRDSRRVRSAPQDVRELAPAAQGSPRVEVPVEQCVPLPPVKCQRGKGMQAALAQSCHCHPHSSSPLYALRGEKHSSEQKGYTGELKMPQLQHRTGAELGPALQRALVTLCIDAQPRQGLSLSGCRACGEGPGAGQPAAPGLGMLVCKLRLYHIIMRCLGYQQISRRLGREGCSTIRKCQPATSSFCRSLNPIFPTCISATGTGPCAGTATRRAQQEQRCREPPAPAVPAPPAPECPRLGWHSLPGMVRGPGGQHRGAQAGMGTLSCTTGAYSGVLNVCCTACQEEQVLPRDSTGTHGCAGGHGRARESHFCAHSGEDATWGAVAGLAGGRRAEGCVEASGQGSQERAEACGRVRGVHMRVSQRGNMSCGRSPRKHRLRGWELTETGDQLNHRDGQHRLPPSHQDKAGSSRVRNELE